MLTENFGLISVLVYNSKKTNGYYQVFNKLDVILKEGKGFWYVHEACMSDSFIKLKQKYNHILCGQLVCTTIRKSMVQLQANKVLYKLCVNTLSQLNQHPDYQSVFDQFKYHYLVSEGLVEHSDPSNIISDERFVSLFEDYTDKRLELPRYLK